MTLDATAEHTLAERQPLRQYNDKYALGIKKDVVIPPGDHSVRVLQGIVLLLPRS